MTEDKYEPKSKERIDAEMEGLRKEIEEFRKEKERVKLIIGQIGGMPNVKKKILGILMFILLIACFVLSATTESATMRLILIEIGVSLISVKLILMMYDQAKVNHFILWILSSLEWRVNEVHKLVNKNKNDDE